METLEDAGLRLGVEVHQRVATGEEVDARDGCILHEIVAPEDDAAPHVLVELVADADLREVLLAERLGDAVDGVGRVGRDACLREGVLVDVGSVDLHALRIAGRAQDLREQDGERVGLLAGCAAGAPDAEHRAPVAGGEAILDEPSHDVPRGRVSEERGHVDQDGVEELRKLVGSDLEVVDVRGVSDDADRLHAPVDTA